MTVTDGREFDVSKNINPESDISMLFLIPQKME